MKPLSQIELDRNRRAAAQRRRFTYEQALAICQEKAAGASVKALVKKYGCSPSVISFIINGKTYPEIQKEPGLQLAMSSCLMCGKHVEKSVWNTRRFCSNVCSDAHVAQHEPNKPKVVRTTTVVRQCLTCGTDTTNMKFCSTVCFAKRPYDHRKFTSGNAVRKYVLRNLPYICSICNISEWCNSPLVLQVDHINGDSTNNDISNLRLLCPNCHSQTPTFCSRNRGNGREYRRKKS